MVKKAVMFGCNYPNSKNELKGCINDVWSMKELIISKGFEEQNINILIDTDPKYTSPTGANMRKALEDLVNGAQSGDILFVHYSGHGTQVPSFSEEDWKNEALCPTDMNLLVDDDLKAIFSKLDPSIKLTVVTDCCHSGGMLDHGQVQIQGDKSQDKPSGTRSIDGENIKNRALSIEQVAKTLSDMLKKPVEPNGQDVRRALDNQFHDQASKFATQFISELREKHNKSGDGSRGFGGLFNKVLDKAQEMVDQFLKPPKLNDDVGVLITGCQSTETSADVRQGGTAFGALSNSISRSMKENPNRSYRDLVMDVRNKLHQGGFSQNPCLECSDTNADLPFIC